MQEVSRTYDAYRVVNRLRMALDMKYQIFLPGIFEVETVLLYWAFPVF